MFKNYFITAWRHLLKKKVHTIINIFGLAVGISASVVIFLIVQYDYSFDKWEPQATNTYEVMSKYSNFYSEAIPSPALEFIKNQIPGIETTSYFLDFPVRDFTVTVSSNDNEKNKIFTNENRLIFADENYFKIFPHHWLAGNPSVSLSQPYEVVLSLSVAKKYFPGKYLDKIIGQRILFGDSTNVVVSGIISDLKQHTDFDNKSFISLKTFTSENYLKAYLPHDDHDAWFFPFPYSHCFVQLYKNANMADMNAQLKKLYDANVTQTDPNFKFTGTLQPLSKIHFGFSLNNKTVESKVDKSVVVNLGLLALALLLLAAINFINLSTALSTLRAKEIGVRKTLGSSKKQIVYQFLTETFLVTVCATLLAIILTPFLLYVFKGFVPEGLDTNEIFQPIVIVFLIVTIIVVTILAGLYPAFVLTKFRPALVLKNQIANAGKSRRAWVREVLTVSQFVIAQVFLIVVIVVGKQIHYELNKDIGIRKDAIVSFRVPGSDINGQEKEDVLINELKKIPQIQNVTSYDAGEPYSTGYSQTGFIISNKGRTENKLVAYKSGDSNYIKVFNIPLLAGRNIRIDTNSTQEEVLINEAMMKEMGFQNPGDAIGSSITRGEGTNKVLIVGVMKDFNIQSLHYNVDPLIFEGNNYLGGKISLALNPTDPSSWQVAIQKTEKTFRQIYPNKEFDYTFFDKEIENIYKADIRLSTLLKWATGLAIFISCLGLLGLVSFMANRRTKEIGIRKVLGASVTQIILLLSKNLGKLILIASIIAIPVAWYFSNYWLRDFAFKISLSWWIFLISGICMLVIAMAILCVQTIKAALANPVESLRSE